MGKKRPNQNENNLLMFKLEKSKATHHYYFHGMNYFIFKVFCNIPHKGQELMDNKFYLTNSSFPI